MTRKDIEIGFWRFNDGFWSNPMKIEDTEIYDTERLIVEVSTLNQEVQNLSASKKRELRRVWAETLPKLDNVKYLMTTHQVDQEFFEAICEMKNLEGLYIKWGKVESIDSISKLENLKHLHFGSNPRIKSIEGISKLKNLITLELENFKNCSDLNKVEKLKELQSLKILSSIDGPRIKFKNLEFLSQLINLKVLGLDVSLTEKRIEPILNLKNLEKLWIPDQLYKKYDKKELRKNFKNLKYGNLTR
jgi:Leucine-rich repeat (LRR) protein